MTTVLNDAPAVKDVTRPTRLWNKNYLLLWQGQFVSKLGDQAFILALNLWVVQATNSATLVGLLLMVSSALGLILGPFGGAVADRYSRRTIIVLTDVVRGLALVALAGLFFLAPTNIPLLVSGLFVIAICLAVCSAFFGPAISAAIPDLVPKERLGNANGLGQFSSEFSLIVGQAAGGTLFRLLGAPLMFLLDGLSFLFAGASTSFITIPQAISAQRQRWQDRVAQFRADLLEGLRYVWGNTGLRALVLVSAVGNFFSAPVLLLLPFYVKDYLGASDDWYGYLLSAFGIGSLLGFLLVSLLPLSGARRAWALLAMMAVDALWSGAMVLVNAPLAVLGLAVLSGATGSFVIVHLTTLLQLATPTELRGRVMSLLSTISGSITPIAFGLAGVVADLTGRNIVAIYLACSLIQIVLSLAILLRRDVRAFLAFEGPPDPDAPQN